MTLNRDGIEVLCFDLGNTLIEFGPRQVGVQNARLQKALEELFGSCDQERLREIRARQIVAPYHNGYRENVLEEVCRELVEELYEIHPSPEQVAVLTDLRHRNFVEMVELGEEVRPLLRRLGGHYRLALLSNYPCGRSIRDGLDKLELTGLFEAIVISGEVGFVKPHRKPFDLLLEQLGEGPEACVYIGDNWLADIQGAKAAGMRAVHTTQHHPYENFPPRDGDHQPDARIAHLEELGPLFLG